MKKKAKTLPSLLELLGGKKETQAREEKKKPSGGKFKRLKSGGYLMQHHDENDAPIPGEEHAIPTLDDLHDHLEEHFGEPNHDEEATAAGGKK